MKGLGYKIKKKLVYKNKRQIKKLEGYNSNIKKHL